MTQWNLRHKPESVETAKLLLSPLPQQLSHLQPNACLSAGAPEQTPPVIPAVFLLPMDLLSFYPANPSALPASSPVQHQALRSEYTSAAPVG